MRRLVIGTAGHIDHGKTTLVRALTGIDTDRLPDEKRRGITIDLGFAHLALGDVQLGIVDVPGHDGFIRNMVAGATGIDLALLVVAADEGVMTQTREHLAIVELLGVRGGVVAVTKADLVEAEWLELVLEEVRDQLRRGPFAGAPIVPVSAERGTGLDELRRALARVAGSAAERPDADLLRLPLDRVFTVRGTGTVVTGTVWSGRVASDDLVRILPHGRSARVRSVQVHGQNVGRAGAGQRAAIALAGVECAELERGDVVVSDDAWEPASILTAYLRVLADAARPVRTRQRVRFHLGTAEIMARVVVLEEEHEIAPAASGWVQLRLETPTVARAGDRFVIRSYSPVTTIGGGIIAEPTATKRKRLAPSDAQQLALMLGGNPLEAVRARLREAGWRGVAKGKLAVETPHAPAAVEAALASLGSAVLRLGDRLLDGALAAQARTRLLAAVQEYHARNPLRPGIEREELRRALPHAAAPTLAEWAMAALLAEGALIVRGGALARAGFQPTLTAEQERARAELLALYQQAALAPPTIHELPAHLRERSDFWPMLKLLESRGDLILLTTDTYAFRSAVEQAVEAVRRELGDGGALTPASFKRVFPISRKFLIPLLEYFDRTGVTVRRGEEREVVRPVAVSAAPQHGG